MAAEKTFWIFDKDGDWRFTAHNSIEDMEIPADHTVVQDNSRKHDWTKAYTLVDGKIVEAAGTLPGHFPPPEAEVAMFKLREERDRLLEDVVDKRSKIYYNQNKTVPKELTDYRQALLDLPDGANPILDDKGNEITNVDWPEIPTE